MSIADTIRTAREQKGLSQAEVSRLVGVSKTAVSKWEKGESAPTRKRASKVAKVLGLRPGDLTEHSRVGFTLLDDKRHERMIPLIAMGEFLSVALRYEEADLSTLPTISADVPEELNVVALRVEDNEMASDVNSGDILLVARDLPPRDDDLVVALVNNDVILRRFRPRGFDSAGRAVFDLCSPNPDVATRTVNAAHPGKVLAVVIEHRKRRL